MAPPGETSPPPEVSLEVMPRIPRLLLLVASLTILLAVPATNAVASGTQEAIFQDDLNLMSNPVGTLQTMRELGVTRVRVGLYWDRVAPAGNRKPAHFSTTNPSDSHYNWGVYDQIVRQAKADGIQVYFLLVGPAPQWATGGGQPSGGPHLQWRPSAKEFGAFVRAAGTRYSGTYKPNGASTALPKISFWSIWNEPNYGIDLAPQATNNNTVEVSALAVPRARRQCVERASGDPSRPRHDPVRRDGAARHGSPRELLRHQAAALAPRAVLRRLGLPSAHRLGRPRPRLPDDVERHPRASPSRIQSCSRPAASPPTSMSRASRRIS